MILKPGLYCDREGILVVAEDRDGEVVVVRVPLDPDGLLEAAERIAEAARRLKQAQTAPGGGKPKIVELRRAAPWN